MKRTIGILCALLLGCLIILGGCERMTVNPFAENLATAVPGVDPLLPEVSGDGRALQTRENAALYFRYLTEPYLAPEYRTVTQAAGQSYEMALIGQLISGPGRSAELGGLFPAGTRVLSTVKQGRTLFVTLSSAIMNGYPDEPSDWQSSAEWREEVPLRRRLCMQSLVATVTENCDVDQVQVLVQQDSLTVRSLRLQKSYFMDGSEADDVIGPMRRDGSLLLEPDTTLRVILSCWQAQDWQRLYQYIALYDPQTGTGRPAMRDFLTTMEQLPRITGFSAGSGSVSPEGERVTCGVCFTLLGGNGAESTVEDRMVRLYRENGLWKTTLKQLTGWLEE